MMRVIGGYLILLALLCLALPAGGQETGQQTVPSPEVEELMQTGVMAFEKHQDALAKTHFEQLLPLARQTRNWRFVMFALNYLGELEKRRGDFLTARSFYEQAIDVSKEHFKQEIPVLHKNLADAYVELGEYAQAFDLYREIEWQFEVSEDLNNQASLQHNWGVLCTRLGDYRRALPRFERALDIYKKLGQQSNIALTLTGIGGIYEEWGIQQLEDGWEELAYMKAFSLYERALDLQHNARERGTTLNNSAKVLDRWYWETRDARHHHEALERFQEAQTLFEQTGAERLLAKTLSHIGEVHLHLHTYFPERDHLQRAEQRLRRALAIQQRIADRSGEWITLSRLGQTAERQQHTGAAIDLYVKAIDILEDVNLTDITPAINREAALAYEWIIRCFASQGDIERTFEYSERARARTFLNHIVNMRLVPHDLKNSALVEQEQQLKTSIRSLEKQIRRYTKSRDEQAGRHDLRMQLEHAQDEYRQLLIDIRHANPQYAALLNVQPPPLADIQAQLDEDTTLLSYFVGADDTLAFILGQKTLQMVRLEISERELRDMLTDALALPDSFHAPVPPVYTELYQRLIAPLHQFLTTPKLGIIPHRRLHYLPFAALNDGERVLNEQFTLFSLPAASVLPLLPEPRPLRPNNALMMARSRYAEDMLPTLMYAIPEAWSLSRLSGATALFEQEATESALKTLAPRASILHLAAHSELNASSPLFSRIWLAPDAENDGHLDVHEVYTLDLHSTALVVLSACDTKLGTLSSGDDLIGLNRAFLTAGAASVIASLWAVNDRVTAFFMTALYQQMMNGKPPVEALQQARRMTRARYPHPYFWAGFVFTGRPG